MTKATDNLGHLASKHFSLSEAERRLLEQVETGEIATYLTDTDFLNDPSQADGWEENRKLRATVLIWLCTDTVAQHFITHRGIQIEGAKIEGRLDLRFAILPFPVAFHRCVFTKVVRLSGASIKSLDLQGSTLVPSDIGDDDSKQGSKIALLARNLHVELSIFLNNGFKAVGKVLLNSATIEGTLDCTNATFDHSDHRTYTLEAQDLEVKGSVLLSEGFKATGGVSLNDSVIEGALICTNATFENSVQEKNALRAQNLKVKGNVLLNKSFKAVGGVLIDESMIGGSLMCNGAALLTPQHYLVPNGDGFVGLRGGNLYSKYTLQAQNLEVRGSAWFSDGFKAMGRATLSGSTIGGNLVFNGGTFGYPKIFSDSPNTTDHALYLQNMNIHGSVVMREAFKAMGVDLFGTHIGGSLECKNCTLENFGTQGGALNAQNIEVKGPVRLSEGFKAIGAVSLEGAIVDGDLSCKGTRFERSSTIDQVFTATSAYVKGNVYLDKDFEALGEVFLYGMTIGGTLTCAGKIEHPKTKLYALVADNMQVSRSVWISSFEIKGGVSLFGASIGGDLTCKGNIERSETRPYALVAESMQVTGSIWLKNFHVNGGISFCNTKISNGLYCKSQIFSPESDNSKLDLEFAYVRTLADSEESWPAKGQLLLEGFTYEKLDSASPNDQQSRLRWLNLQNQDLKKGGRFSPQPYEQLAKILKDSGHESDAIGVLIGKQEDMRRYGRLGCWGRCWNRFLGLTIAHGYKPTRAAILSLAVIVFGTGMFHIGYRDGLIKASDLEAYTIAAAEDSSLTYSEFFPLAYSLDVFLPIIDLHQTSYWIPKAGRGGTLLEIEFLLLEIRWGGILLLYFWLQIMLGWVLTSLWVAGFTGLVRRIE